MKAGARLDPCRQRGSQNALQGGGGGGIGIAPTQGAGERRRLGVGVGGTISIPGGVGRRTPVVGRAVAVVELAVAAS